MREGRSCVWWAVLCGMIHDPSHKRDNAHLLVRNGIAPETLRLCWPTRRSPFAAGAAVKMAESGDSISRDVTQYLALRPSEDEFREMQREEAAKRMAAMEGGLAALALSSGNTASKKHAAQANKLQGVLNGRSKKRNRKKT